MIGPFLAQPEPPTENVCLTAHSEVGHACMKPKAKRYISHFDVLNYFVLTPERGPARRPSGERQMLRPLQPRPGRGN